MVHLNSTRLKRYIEKTDEFFDFADHFGFDFFTDLKRFIDLKKSQYSNCVDPRILMMLNSSMVKNIDELSLNREFMFIYNNQKDWSKLYNSLGDFYSKRTLIQILTYRILGYNYVQLPLNNLNFFRYIRSLERYISKNIDHNTESFKIILTSQNIEDQYNFEIIQNTSALYSSYEVFNEIIYSQYHYRGDTIDIRPKKNDTAIDCGACTGVSSMFFSICVGNNGKVLSFEFDDENLKKMTRNIEKNLDLKNIQIIKNPLWSKKDMFFQIAGIGASRKLIHNNLFENLNKKAKNFSKYVKRLAGRTTKDFDEFSKIPTTTIDYQVDVETITRVDFIKMDIE